LSAFFVVVEIESFGSELAKTRRRPVKEGKSWKSSVLLRRMKEYYIFYRQRAKVNSGRNLKIEISEAASLDLNHSTLFDCRY